MMSQLLSRGERLAREAQRRKIAEIAAHLRELAGSGKVEVDDQSVMLSGRGMISRWLSEPLLRFLGGGLQ